MQASHQTSFPIEPIRRGSGSEPVWGGAKCRARDRIWSNDEAWSVPLGARRCVGELFLERRRTRIPAVYEVGGKQYIVFCAAAQVGLTPATQERIRGAYVAFTLP